MCISEVLVTPSSHTPTPLAVQLLRSYFVYYGLFFFFNELDHEGAFTSDLFAHPYCCENHLTLTDSLSHECAPFMCSIYCKQAFRQLLNYTPGTMNLCLWQHQSGLHSVKIKLQVIQEFVQNQFSKYHKNLYS